MALFDVAADAYVRFMGRFSALLSAPFADVGLAGVDPAARVRERCRGRRPATSADCSPTPGCGRWRRRS
jgi:hypothetical protein